MSKSGIQDLIYIKDGIEKSTTNDYDKAKAEVLSQFSAWKYTLEPPGSPAELKPQTTECKIDELIITPEMVAEKPPQFEPGKVPRRRWSTYTQECLRKQRLS